MKKIIVGILFGLTVGCASLTPLQVAQQTHDYLALAQDTEARLCWGVPSVAAAMAANVQPNHCQAGAAAFGLTDARHQAINAEFAKAIELHRNVTVLLATGAAADLGPLRDAINRILDEVRQLRTTTQDVATLQIQLEKAGAQ